MKTKSQHAAAATAIKAELKKHFPKIVFSVKSESYSMGSSVRVSWTDGPRIQEINEIGKKYQYGMFNSQEDYTKVTIKEQTFPR